MGYSHASELRKDILRNQGNRCAICNDDNPGREFHLDHDHRKGGVRGVLCHRCNHGLGKFCDSPELLRRAAEYLERSRVIRFPRLHMTREEAGRKNVKYAFRVAISLPRSKKQMNTIRRANAIRWGPNWKKFQNRADRTNATTRRMKQN